MTTLDKFGLMTDPPKEKKILGIFEKFGEARDCARAQRLRDPNTRVHLDYVEEGKRMVWIEVPA